MSAFAETLAVAWKEAGIDVCTVQSVTGTRLTAGNGKIRGHSPKEYLAHDLTTVKIFQCLYVDDGAFIFSSRDNLIQGVSLIHHHFARLGLEMHIGCGTTPSKTECVFFPPMRFFSSMLPPNLIQETGVSDDTLNHDINEALTKTKQQQEETMKQHRAGEELLYDNLEETAPIPVSDRQVTFCRHVKYLGSYVSFCLYNDYDIDKRITDASQAMGAIKTMWDCPHLELWSKYLLFRSTPMNILLWGCKTWSMRKALANKLKIFLHCSIRRFLHVSITRVKEERIRNEHVRRMFYDIPCIGNMIAARQMDFIGKNICAPPHSSSATDADGML